MNLNMGYMSNNNNNTLWPHMLSSPATLEPRTPAPITLTITMFTVQIKMKPVRSEMYFFILS